MSADQPDDDDPPRRTSGARPEAAKERRRARVLAFQTLYEVDVARHPPGEVLRRFAGEQPASEEFAAYAREIVGGVLQHRAELDHVIHERAPAWPLAQMSAVDRNILRIGLFECMHRRDTVAPKTAINDSIELAKMFGSESSPRFVNGVLAGVVESLAAESEGGKGSRS